METTQSNTSSSQTVPQLSHQRPSDWPQLLELTASAAAHDTRKESWFEQLTEQAALLGAIVSLLGLFWLILSDVLAARTNAKNRNDNLAVTSALETGVDRSFTRDQIKQASGLSESSTSDALTRLVTDGLVTIRADGTYKLATTEFLEISTQLDESNVALNEQVRLIQNQVRLLEEKRNNLLEQGNLIQDEIVSLHNQHNQLRDQTNTLAKQSVALMASNNQYLGDNVNLLRSIAQPPIDIEEVETAARLILDGRIEVTEDEKAIVERIDTAVVVEIEDAIQLYKVLHHYFPSRFPKPTEDPTTDLNSPELNLFKVLGQLRHTNAYITYPLALDLLQQGQNGITVEDLKIVRQFSESDLSFAQAKRLYAILYKYFPEDFEPPTMSLEIDSATPEVWFYDFLKINHANRNPLILHAPLTSG